MKREIIIICLLFSSVIAIDDEAFFLSYINNESMKLEEKVKDICTATIMRRGLQGLKGENLIAPFVSDDNIDSLNFLMIRGYLDVIKIIVGFDPEIIHNTSFYEALRVAIVNRYLNNINFLSYFINKKGNIHKLLKYFSDQKCKANSQIGNRTFLSLMCRKGLPIVKSLLINNANPNVPSIFGFTGLHESVYAPCLKKKSDQIRKNINALIVSGADYNLTTCDFSGYNEQFSSKTAIEIANMKERGGLARLIQAVVNERIVLFNRVKSGEDIDFMKDKDCSNINYISRRHVRDIHGSSLLYYALKYKNDLVAKKLISLWPELFHQPNFYKKTVLDILPFECGRILMNIP